MPMQVEMSPGVTVQYGVGVERGRKVVYLQWVLFGSRAMLGLTANPPRHYSDNERRVCSVAIALIRKREGDAELIEA